MKIIDKKLVPVYQVECYECKSIIQYTAAEVHYGHITCPVCRIGLWAMTIMPVCYETDEDMREKEPTEEKEDAKR